MSPPIPKTIIVAMSGGVDSAVTAALLKKLGHNIIGVTMKLWNGPETTVTDAHHGCYGPGEAQDIGDAQDVADRLEIPFHVFDLAEEYKSDVLDYFSLEYLSGRTPNPCVRCNRNLKFGTLLRRVEESGIAFDCMATGHYARLEYNAVQKRHLLKKAADFTKDQSYFLAQLSQQQLARSTFPLGGLQKSEVRKLAHDFGLPVASKVESQDFVAGNYASVLPEGSPGPILDRDGNQLGEHHSIAAYTIGQRRGLGISSKEPMFVVDIAAERNAVIVGDRKSVV
jgi:tRNA-uridine 2-sulfurtransferase